MTKNFLIVDEAEIAKQKYISVLVGSLDAPNQTFLVDCHLLDSGSNVYSSIILHTVDDILRQLEIKRENFSLLLTSGHQTTARGPDPAREAILSGPLYVVQNTKRIIKKTITVI